MKLKSLFERSRANQRAFNNAQAAYDAQTPPGWEDDDHEEQVAEHVNEVLMKVLSDEQHNAVDTKAWQRIMDFIFQRQSFAGAADFIANLFYPEDSDDDEIAVKWEQLVDALTPGLKEIVDDLTQEPDEDDPRPSRGRRRF